MNEASNRVAAGFAWAAVFAPPVSFMAGLTAAYLLGTSWDAETGALDGLGLRGAFGVAGLYGGLTACVGSWLGVGVWAYAMYRGGASARVRALGLLVNAPGLVASLWFLPLLPTLLGTGATPS